METGKLASAPKIPGTSFFPRFGKMPFFGKPIRGERREVRTFPPLHGGRSGEYGRTTTLVETMPNGGELVSPPLFFLFADDRKKYPMLLSRVWYAIRLPRTIGADQTNPMPCQGDRQTMLVRYSHHS